MQQVYVVKTRKKIFITINMTIIAWRIDDNDATMIAYLALLPPSQCCLTCIPHIVMSLTMFPYLRPLSLSQHFLAHVPCVIRSLAPLPCLPCVFACWRWWWPRPWIPAMRHCLTRPGMGEGCGGWGGGLVAVIHNINAYSWSHVKFSHLENKTNKYVVGRGD